ncbi:AAA family ATPase [Lentilactobacillus sp. Marseille-Q4993]|uniref:guanylate kinase n=1 Tax=Lentilactobacillus sp. Marseille-Q4993 TaxID=3039492 RepID=UPI0024BBF4FC|nr:AAA family ATPase [Lentilactobacillus sp. Marseille-Q4993]
MAGKKIFVITGAAGSGKTTVRNYLTAKFGMTKVITHTTRQPRGKEQNGVDYYFETRSTFAANHFLESVEYDGNLYGSSYEGLERAWDKSDDICIVLDTAGAITYQEKLGAQVVVIFLKAPSPELLLKRMTLRGDDTSKIMQRVKSHEYRRDLELPVGLKGKAHIIENSDLEKTQRLVDDIVENYR